MPTLLKVVLLPDQGKLINKPNSQAIPLCRSPITYRRNQLNPMHRLSEWLVGNPIICGGHLIHISSECQEISWFESIG